MKRKFMVMATAILVSSSMLFSSCIGSFSLFNKLLGWNNTVGDKWVNELVFIALWIVPVYEIASFIDIVILNSIEFWTGENPTAEVKVQEIDTKEGKFIVTTDANGHKVQKAGSDELVEFRFNADVNGWDLVVDNEDINPLFQFVGDNQALVYLANGSTMTVDLSQAGMMAFRQVIQNKTYFAAR